MLNVLDPATNTPFPTPLPRSALPFVPDPQLSSAYQNWRISLITMASRAQTNAMLSSIMGNRPTYNFGGFGGTGGFGAGAGAGAGSPYVAQLQAQNQMMQAQLQAQRRTSMIKAAGSIASTLLGVPSFNGFGSGS
jgi:hypothetical protein